MNLIDPPRKGIVRFTIPGEPCGKGRPKFTTRGGYARAVTPAKTANYETLVKMEYQQQCPGIVFDRDKALGMRITAYKAPPSSASKRKAMQMLDGAIFPGKKPDWDNLGKIICDALNGIAYIDDAQIVDAHVIKRYARVPFVEVEIWEEGVNG